MRRLPRRVSCVCQLSLTPCLACRHLLLDGRANAEVAGAKALRRLAALRSLTLPLLHLQHSARPVLAALQAALPDAHISNVGRVMGAYSGPQWTRSFSREQQEWWRAPRVPWAWQPMLVVTP